MSLPCIKFITHLTSYLFFIILVISSYFVEEQDPVNFLNHFPKYNQSFANYTSGCFSYMVNFENFYIRETKPTVLDFIISFWVIGQTWHELKKLFVLGIYDYMRSSSNTFSFTMNVFYITAYGLRFYTMYVVNSYIKSIETSSVVFNGLTFWQVIESLNSSDVTYESDKAQIFVYEVFYWMNSGN